MYPSIFSSTNASIVKHIGIEPDHPSSSYKYYLIHPGGDQSRTDRIVILDLWNECEKLIIIKCNDMGTHVTITSAMFFKEYICSRRITLIHDIPDYYLNISERLLAKIFPKRTLHLRRDISQIIKEIYDAILMDLRHLYTSDVDKNNLATTHIPDNFLTVKSFWEIANWARYYMNDVYTVITYNHYNRVPAPGLSSHIRDIYPWLHNYDRFVREDMFTSFLLDRIEKQMYISIVSSCA
jgi:hypothetical protein